MTIVDSTVDLPTQREAPRVVDAAAGTGRVTRPRNQYWDVARAAWVVCVDQNVVAAVDMH